MAVTSLYKHCGGIFGHDLNHQNQLLGMFAKLRKVTVSFMMPVCLCPYGTSLDSFHETWYLSVF